MNTLKSLNRYVQKKIKIIFYTIFKLVYGSVTTIRHISKLNDAEIFKCELDRLSKYSIYSLKNVRLYTNRVHDMSVIKENVLIEGPSYQLRNLNSQKKGAMDNARIEENDVLKYGTPRFKKKIRGTVLSLLSGGAANNNYFHWIYDVLPRLALCEKINIFDKIDYFLLPNLDLNFQKETLNFLNINSKKLLNSKKYRHIYCNNLVVTDHPFVINNNADIEIHNIPQWINKWLKKKFEFLLEKKTGYPKKIYIDRSDAKKDNTKYAREIINEEEIKFYLKNKDFSFIRLAELSFKEQINIFYNADLIVGLHGSGFANLSFCRPKTKIIEIKSDNAGKVLQNIALNSGLDCKELIYKPHNFDAKSQQGKVLVNLEHLKNIID